MKKPLLLVLILIISCNTDKLNLNYFNNSQKKILKELLERNDNILKKSDNESVANAYYKQLEKLDNSISASDVINNSFVKDVTPCKLLKENNIFKLVKVRVHNPSDKSYHIALKYALNYKSKYLDFLKFYSSKNKVIFKYYKFILLTGDMTSPVLTKILLHELTKEDLENQNIRLIVCMHFLLLNNS